MNDGRARVALEEVDTLPSWWSPYNHLFLSGGTCACGEWMTPSSMGKECQVRVDAAMAPQEVAEEPEVAESDEQSYEDTIRTATPRPTSWDGVVGNAVAVEQLQEALLAAKKQRRPLPHTLLFGPPGAGKSTLSKIVAREFGGGFIETTASTLETPSDVVRILWELNEARERTGQPAVLFVDEIHRLGDARGRQSIDQESVYGLLEDWRFDHNLLGKTVGDRAGVEWRLTESTVKVWPFTVIGATNEPGLLSAPLLRRFLLHVELQPYTESEIGQIIVGSAERLGWPVDTGAGAELAKYARLNPGQGYRLLTSAHNRAVATDRDVITRELASEVVERLRLYPLGLTENDVRVLKILADRAPRGAGQAEIARALGVSLSTFGGLIEPYLRQLSFLETLARRVITARGLAYLAKIGQADMSRPEVRAAVERAS
jgi:Holliday junction DNA helicase RuvB